MILIVRNFYIFWTQLVCQIYVSKIFSHNLWIGFYFLSDIFSLAKYLILRKPNNFFFSLSYDFRQNIFNYPQVDEYIMVHLKLICEWHRTQVNILTYPLKFLFNYYNLLLKMLVGGKWVASQLSAQLLISAQVMILWFTG